MRVEELLEKHGVSYEKRQHATAYTAQGLAQTEHVSGFMVAKPVVVKADREFAMCVVPAPLLLDLNRVREFLHANRVRLATENELAELFPDCELGAEPPIGRLYGMRTVMDEHLIEDDYLLMQAGSHNESIRMRRADWERVTQPLRASISVN